MSEKFEFNKPANKALPDPTRHPYKQYKVPSDAVLAVMASGEWLSTPAVCARLEGGRLRRRVMKSRVEWSLR